MLYFDLNVPDFPKNICKYIFSSKYFCCTDVNKVLEGTAFHKSGTYK